MQIDRTRLAASFLQEAVFRSRGAQSTAGLDPFAQRPATCGLGDKAAVSLGLEGRGKELFQKLWDAPDEAEVARIRRVTADWVRRQDGYDRKRNHFLKAFRQEHGFDRNAYSQDTLEQYDAGLAEINAEVNEALERAAQELAREGRPA